MDFPSRLQLDQITHISKPKIFMVRCDLIHPEISGNKWFKLKYNIEKMKSAGQDNMLTLGGPHSNHIAATAAAGKHFNFKTLGVIRGEKTAELTPTLKKAVSNGMEVKFLSRSEYDQYKLEDIGRMFLEENGSAYLLPEGGANVEALIGCSEILTEMEKGFQLICCPVGTGATLAGIIVASEEDQKVIGYSALKSTGDQVERIKKLLSEYDKTYNTNHSSKRNWSLKADERFGGFANMDKTLLDYSERFIRKEKIQLDFIYTAKMMYSLEQQLEMGELTEFDKILVTHTGGIQGNDAMISRLKQLFVS